MPELRIAKPLLLTTTPIGVGFGLYEAAKVGTWLLALMILLLSVVSVATWITVRRIRLDRAGDAHRHLDS
jgi:hypothetical protein